MGKTLLTAEHVRFQIAGSPLIDIDQFELSLGDRIALVGANGVGKSTLIGLLAGEIRPDEGTVTRYAPVAVIHQMLDQPPDQPLDAGIAARLGAQAAGSALSGGERARRRIASALSARAPILLADEPTNDLDQAGLDELEAQLKAHKGALLLVSHDRRLMDSVARVVCELSDGHLTIYPGNYSAYVAARAQRLARRQFEYDQYRRAQAQLRGAIQEKREHASQVGQLPTRMGNSEARLHKRATTEVEEKLNGTRKALESRLKHLTPRERPPEDAKIRMNQGALTRVVSKTVLTLRDMAIRFDQRVLLENASMTLPTGSHTALLGPNGCGKTTLIRRLLAPNDQRVRLAPGTKCGYFGQDHQATLDFDKTILENLLPVSVLPESEVRTVLARMNLRGDACHKLVQCLSGGERAKVALTKLLISDVSLLILDEPTNHLDLCALEALEGLLRDSAATLLLVSHDRQFVAQVATRLVFFEGTSLVTFEGDMAAYQANKDRPVDAQLTRLILELRMADLAARIPRESDQRRRAPRGKR
ncbi:MAG: ABC-F family ATP-binding cassette domain-containing protein [Clostridia bacterium]